MEYTLMQTSVYAERQHIAVDLFVIHESAGHAPGDLYWLVAGGSASRRVSANWYIDPVGQLYQLDQENRATAHAGESSWEGEINHVIGGWGSFNLRSEGVEISGRNNGGPIAPSQLATLVELVKWRSRELGIAPSRIVRHCDIAPGRKTDPLGLNWGRFLATMWPDHTTVRAAPRCTFAQFEDLLDSYSSPALPQAQEIWNYFVSKGLDPAGAVAIFEHESSCGVAGRATQTQNWGNLRAGNGRQKTIVGGFAMYSGDNPWLDSAADFCDRLLERYAGTWGLTTYERLIPTYAPRRDSNQPTAYIAAVRKRILSFGAAAPAAPAVVGIGDFSTTPQLAQFYDRHGGVLVFGYPLRDSFEAPDVAGEVCTWLPCENVTLKVKPSEPDPWRIRPAAIDEAINHR